MMKSIKIKKGFTLLEVLMAIFVIVVGLIAGITAISQALILSNYSSSKLTAAYLAQEGIEIIRNIRDTNWLQEWVGWELGLVNCSGGCIADYTSSSVLDPNLQIFSGQFLSIDSNGFYSYAPGGTPTKFKRVIIIQMTTWNNVLAVTVNVTWSDQLGDHTFTVKDNLQNWLRQ